MTEAEALLIVDKLVTAIQRYRSMAVEELQSDVLEIARDLQDYTLGEAQFLEILMEIQDRQTMAPIDFYNMMFMADRMAPEAKVAYAGIHGEALPEPDLELVAKGWSDAQEGTSQ